MTNSEFKRIRSDLGITQKQLAEWLKSSLRSVQRWESGERAISGPVSVCMTGFIHIPPHHIVVADLIRFKALGKAVDIEGSEMLDPRARPQKGDQPNHYDGFKALGEVD